MPRLLTASFCLALLLATAAPAHTQDADSLKFRPVSLGVLFQTSISGEHLHVNETNVTTHAGLGMEAGGFIDYNITPTLCFELQLILALQGLGHIRENTDELVTLFGMDLPLYFMARFPVRRSRLRIGAGPFTHITFDAWNPSNRQLVTPYRQVISIDESGKRQYALNNYYAGIGLLIGWEFPSGFQINLGGSYSVMDILNYQHDYGSFNHPYKFTLGVGWRF